MPEKKFIFDESQNHDLDTDSDDANDTEASSRDHRAAAEADIGRTFGAKLKHFFAERVLPVSDPAEAAERQGNPLLHKNARIAYGVLLVFAVTLNLYAVSRLSVHLLGSWAENVLYVLRFDSVSLRSVSFAQVCAILAYIFSFIFGGMHYVCHVKIGRRYCGRMQTDKKQQISDISADRLYCRLCLRHCRGLCWGNGVCPISAAEMALSASFLHRRSVFPEAFRFSSPPDIVRQRYFQKNRKEHIIPAAAAENKLAKSAAANTPGAFFIPLSPI